MGTGVAAFRLADLENPARGDVADRKRGRNNAAAPKTCYGDDASRMDETLKVATPFEPCPPGRS